METYQGCFAPAPLFISNFHIQRQNGRTCSLPFPSLHSKPTYSTAGGRITALIRSHHITSQSLSDLCPSQMLLLLLHLRADYSLDKIASHHITSHLSQICVPLRCCCRFICFLPFRFSQIQSQQIQILL